MRGYILRISLLFAVLGQLAFNVNPANSKSLDKTATPIDPSKIVDLTQTLAKGIPTYQGDSEAFKYTTISTIAKGGYAIGSFQMPEHCGTHIDAPCHFSEGGVSIDELPAKDLVVPCVVINVQDEVNKDPDYCLTLDKIKAFEKENPIPANGAVLLLTGWSKRWSNPETYRNADASGTMHFPGFSKEAADYLTDKKHATYLGIDTLSLDPGNSKEHPVHHSILAKGAYLIENLTALEQLPAKGALLFCGPLKIKGGTGSPARVVAVLP